MCFFEPVFKGFRKAAAKLTIRGVEFNLLCPIACDQAAGAGKIGFQWVENEGGNNIVMPREVVEELPRRVIITFEIAHDADKRIVRSQPAGFSEYEVEAV